MQAPTVLHQRKSLRISSRPVRERTHASLGRGNAPDRTIADNICNTAGHFDCRAHLHAKLPGSAVPGASQLLRSLHPPCCRRRCFREVGLSGRVPPRPLCPHRCRQYTPVCRPMPPYCARFRPPKDGRARKAFRFRIETPWEERSRLAGQPQRIADRLEHCPLMLGSQDAIPIQKGMPFHYNVPLATFDNAGSMGHLLMSCSSMGCR